MIDLLSVNDPDWALFQSGDPEYFLRTAGEAIRTDLGWHLFPSVTETIVTPLGAKGIIMLPSRWVTAVQSITAFQGADEVLIEPGTYEVFGKAGYVQLASNAYGEYYRGFYYGPDPAIHVAPRTGFARVSMTHGYDTLPLDIKAVIFELAEGSMENSSGNYKEIKTPDGFELQPTQNYGLTLNPDQCRRLAKYRISEPK